MTPWSIYTLLGNKKVYIHQNDQRVYIDQDIIDGPHFIYLHKKLLREKNWLDPKTANMIITLNSNTDMVWINDNTVYWNKIEIM